ncbi:MAG TPA: FAD-linked oxidase C-terminal domain-containing protein [Pyrinomonadaceae bacterium]|nr:FAD-linked oxidase C-terminal domain-containing protein [Pyrinomonadaceae bacterium]
MDALVKDLRAILKAEQVVSDAEELLVYECDGLTHYRHRPRAVVFPTSTEEVSEVLKLLARERVAVVPRGAGTGLSGGALAVGGGVCVELARMRRVLKVDAENRLAVVEAGVVNAQISRAVAPHGLYYVPDPSSQASCTVGGNVGENAGGIHCLKYGTTTDHVLGARVVLSGGRVVELGGTCGQAPGYDLMGVFVGSEGTFGVATEITVKLTPVAPSVRTLLADFLRLDDASRAVSAIIAAGIIPAGLEMVDGVTIRAVEASVFAAGMPTDAEAALLVELDGLEAGMDEEVARVRQICSENGSRSVRLAVDEVERKKLWAARKGAFGAMGRITPDILIQDAVVPRSRLPEVLANTYRIGARYGLRVANVFHAGDGNLHPLVCFDSRDADQVARVKEAGREIMETCVAAGGTITGEHGVGLDKSAYLPLVFNEDDMRAMLQVRAAFDPDGLCNPGKIIPVLKGCGEARAVASAKMAARGGVESKNAGEVAASQSQPLEASATPDAEWEAVGGKQLPRERVGALANPLEALANVVGHAHVHTDDGEGAHIVAEPASAEEVCRVLRLAEVAGLKVSPAGACVQHNLRDDSLPVNAVVLKTTRMARLVEHEPADLVATAEAGMTLADFNHEVGRAGQWLPLDPPGGAAATLGGIVATGASGAQALGYGAPRSYVLGMKVALAGGRVIRVGGRVVKNVAGYDLCKLFTGSQGTLGVILEITFKLRPRPRREATIVARSSDLPELFAAARAVVGSQLLPVAVELLSPGMAGKVWPGNERGEFMLLARFAGTEGAVEYQLARAAEIIEGSAKDVRVSVESENDFILWSRLAASAAANDGLPRELVWRLCVPPSSLGLFLSRLSEVSRYASQTMWHAGAGDGRLRVFEALPRDGHEYDRDKLDAARLLGELREEARAAGGSLVVERTTARFSREFDSWGLSESAASLMKRIKEQLDPSDTFSPGRFSFADGRAS